MSEFGKGINAPSRKGVFIPDITVEMFRNASLESVEDLMASGEMEDILLPSVQPERTEYIPDTKAVRSKRDCVDLAERVVATFYDQEHEEWTQQTVTIADVLDSVCDEYTVLPPTQPQRQPPTEDDYAYCAECNSVEMCRWYPLYGCQFRSLPSAQPQRKKGQLLYHHTENIDEVKTADVYFCSSCKKEVLKKIRFGMFSGELDIQYGYCPHCGAIYGGDAK